MLGVVLAAVCQTASAQLPGTSVDTTADTTQSATESTTQTVTDTTGTAADTTQTATESTTQTAADTTETATQSATQTAADTTETAAQSTTDTAADNSETAAQSTTDSAADNSETPAQSTQGAADTSQAQDDSASGPAPPDTTLDPVTEGALDGLEQLVAPVTGPGAAATEFAGTVEAAIELVAPTIDALTPTVDGLSNAITEIVDSTTAPVEGALDPPSTSLTGALDGTGDLVAGTIVSGPITGTVDLVPGTIVGGPITGTVDPFIDPVTPIPDSVSKPTGDASAPPIEPQPLAGPRPSSSSTGPVPFDPPSTSAPQARDLVSPQLAQLGLDRTLHPLSRSVLDLSPAGGTSAILLGETTPIATLADASGSQASPGASGIYPAPGSPGGAAGTTAPPPGGGLSFTWLAVLMALAGLAALLFERLRVPSAAWRSLALISLLERPG